MRSILSRYRRYTRPLLVLLLLVCLLQVAPADAQGGPPPTDAPKLPASTEYVPGELLVRFKSAAAPRRLDQLLKEQRLTRVREIAPLGVQLFRLPAGVSVEQAMAALKRLPEVERVEPNLIFRTLQIEDPGLANQWAPDKIEAPAAWQITPGDPSVLIAIVDTGVDYRHSELAPNLWSRPGEVPNNGLDDDGNGYIDDVHGWDFQNRDAEPLDDHFHGTHVAGITAAAPTNNPQGLVGICPNCRLLPVKVLDAQGSGSLANVASGLIYAADSGARVINLSLGATMGAATLEDAVNYAWNKGALVVAGAGNNGGDVRLFPAAYPNAMAIAASNVDDLRSCFSNYGAGYLSVTAPGELIYSTTPLNAAGQDTYGTYSGTSMATPHVSGLAGLLLSQNPARSNAELRQILESTAVDLGPAGRDDFFGAGRIHALRALQGDTSATVPPALLSADHLAATGYAYARKLVRDEEGRLHWVWHSVTGGYRILYATSADGSTWSSPLTLLASSAETGDPTLATDGASLYLAFASRQGSANPRIWFASKALAKGDWSAPTPILGGAFSAARPSLYLDPGNGRLHLVAASDSTPTLYYTTSDDGGQSWSPARTLSVGPTTQTARYAIVHAHGSQVSLAVRTTEPAFFGLMARFRLLALSSADAGQSWSAPLELSSASGGAGADPGFSLAGVGDRLDLAYGQGGSVYWRQSQDGLTWEVPLEIGQGAWPSVTQADDGQAWVAWEDEGSLWLRRFTGSGWDSPEWILEANSRSKSHYPNLKLGTSGGWVEWVTTYCTGAPFGLIYGGRSLADMPVSYPLAWSAASYQVDEGAGAATIEVVLSQAATRTVLVDYFTRDGTALAGKDYTAVKGTLTFAAGETRKTISVPLKNDSNDEPDQSVLLTLSNPVNALLGDPAIATLVILDNDAPPVVGFSSTRLYSNESAGAATGAARLSAASEFAVTVEYAANDGTATAGADYGTASGTLTFAPGETSRSFTVPILDDILAEADETVLLQLSNPTNATLGTALATLTLDDNDTLKFSVSTYTAKENVGEALITVKLSAASAYEVRVEYATVDGGAATPGEDYTPTSGTLVLAPGQTSQTFAVPVVDDILAEPDETIKLLLSNPTNAGLGSPAAATLNLDDNDTLKFSLSFYTVNESAGAATITVKLSAASSLPVRVGYATSNGTALAGLDYVAASGVLEFAPGETARTFTVPILDELRPEADETLKLALFEPVSAGLGTPNTATLTIADNDTLKFSLSSYTVKENVGAATLTVKLSDPSPLPVTVDYATSNGTAAASSDYEAASGTLVFAPGETSKTITIPIVDDLLAESSETVKVTLSNPVNAGFSASAVATLNLTDNDTLRFSLSSYFVKENLGLATITVKLSAASDVEVRVDYATISGGTATAGVDYLPTSGTLVFAPGETSQTFAVVLLDDTAKEGNETIKLALSNPVNGGLGTPSAATLTIQEND